MARNVTKTRPGAVCPGAESARPTSMVFVDGGDLAHSLEAGIEVWGYPTTSNLDFLEHCVLALVAWAGLEVSQQDAYGRIVALRRNGYIRPLIVVTRGDISLADFERLLLAGADDCLDATASTTLLRCQSWLRHSSGIWACVRPIPIAIDHDARAITIHGHTIQLPPTPFRILAFLIHNRDRWVSESELFQEVLQTHHAPGSALVRVNINSIRKALGPVRDTLRSERFRGYMFRP